MRVTKLARGGLRISLGALFVTGYVAVVPASATVLRYDWSAVIDDHGPSSFGLVQGSVVSGSFTVDSLSGVPDNFDPSTGTDYQATGIQTLDLPDSSPVSDVAAPALPSTAGGHATVADNRVLPPSPDPFDSFKVGASFSLSDSPGVSGLFFSLLGPTWLFADQSLPLVIDVADFTEFARVQINFRGPGGTSRTGSLTSVAASVVSQVPVPGTLPLLATGAFVAAILRRRRVDAGP